MGMEYQSSYLILRRNIPTHAANPLVLLVLLASGGRIELGSLLGAKSFLMFLKISVFNDCCDHGDNRAVLWRLGDQPLGYIIWQFVDQGLH
jgi:hypothetical protein